MAACDTQTLLNDASCLSCLSPGVLDLIKIRLLCNIASALDPDMTCDPQTLLNEAACFSCLSPGMLNLIQTQLLCNIAGSISGGGGAGAGCMLETNGDPEGVLTANCSPALAVDPATSAIYLFTGVAGTNTGWALKV